MFRVRILSYLGKMFDFGLTRLDFRHNSLKYGQFQTLKIPIFSETRSKLLSCVCFKYLEPSIAIWSGETTIVSLDLQYWEQKGWFSSLSPTFDQFLTQKIPEFIERGLKLLPIVCFNYLESSITI